MSRIGEAWRGAWQILRALAGEDAYERYLAHQRHRHPGAVPMGRDEFYRSELDRRWSQVNRCC
jgi:uncharacterized short protein YbdD (DUF466 family)